MSWQALSNDTLSSKIGPVDEKLPKFITPNECKILVIDAIFQNKLNAIEKQLNSTYFFYKYFLGSYKSTLRGYLLR